MIADSVHALLKISDIVCARAGLTRNELGSERGEPSLPRRLAEKSSALRQMVQFGFDELEQLGIDLDDLVPFIFNPQNRKALLEQSITNSELEACPLGVDGDQLYLLLPTAVSAAIRRFFISALGTGDNRQVLLSSLGREYIRLLDESSMLGGRAPTMPFSHLPWGSVCCVSTEIDKGRYLCLVLFMDTLEDFMPLGLAGMYMANERFCEEVQRVVTEAQNAAMQRPGFQDGITLLIGCGVGRGAAFPMPVEAHEQWKTEILSAPDYCTLSRTQDMTPLNLWRIMQMRSALDQMDVWLQNMNGFLNLYAWADSLKGHLIPHADIPESTGKGRSLNIGIVQNGLLSLRHKVTHSIDCHVEQFVDGSWRVIQTSGTSDFEEDDSQPLYAHLQHGEERAVLGACITSNRCWWYDLASPVDGPDTRSYDRWKMLGVWLARAVQPLERTAGSKLGKDPILWRCVFETPPDAVAINKPGTAQDAIDAIRTIINVDRRTVELHVGAGFNRAIFHEENIAEKALVAAFVTGVMQLVGLPMESIDRIVHEIVPNAEMRHAHMFPAKSFRDYIHGILDQEPVVISQFDDAAEKLGIGWRVHNPDDGGRIEGKTECMTFLNALVHELEDELCRDVAAFNRSALLSRLLFNHEVTSAARERWLRTAAAILALRSNQEAALRMMGMQEFKRNAVFQTSRNLIEMAICESPIIGGREPGDLDLARLMIKATMLYHYGGWSDLMRWDLLEPVLIVRPLGDVHAKLDFVDTVMGGFGNAASDYRYLSSARDYAKHLEHPQVSPESSGTVEQEFLAAWRDEFGVDFDACRRFVDAVENYAIERQQAVIQLARSALVALADNVDVGSKIVENFSLLSRPSWRRLPDGYEHRDIAPWRFRRRLGLLRRPLLQLTDDDDPTILFAPGLLREGLASTVANYYNASYPDWHLGPAMRRYAGYARNRDGLQFNQEVGARMVELGWQAEPEVRLTKILRQALDRDYGDVDVLAWDVDSGRVLVMECKDLQFKKTYGEIAEQLGDFRGTTSADGKRRDLLRKHLDRVEVLRNHIAEVKKYLGVTGDCTIESHIVFRHPVPMQFTTGSIREHSKLHIFDNLDKLKCDLS